MNKFKNEKTPKTNFTALVSAHIWVNENGNKEIELLDFVHNDHNGTDIFSEIDSILLEEINTGDKKDHFFMAIVNSEFVRYDYWEGEEWDVESEVIEIKKLDDIKF